MKPKVAVANVLITRDGYLLMGQRPSGQWEIAGGKVEDETLVDAARREQFEESGMELLGQPLFAGYVESVGNNKRWLAMYWLWKEWLGFPRRMEPDKSLGWRWFRLDELPDPSEMHPPTAMWVERWLPTVVQVRQSQLEEEMKREMETVTA